MIKKIINESQQETRVDRYAFGLKRNATVQNNAHGPALDVLQEREGDAAPRRVVCHAEECDPVLDDVVEDMPVCVCVGGGVYVR